MGNSSILELLISQKGTTDAASLRRMRSLAACSLFVFVVSVFWLFIWSFRPDVLRGVFLPYILVIALSSLLSVLLMVTGRHRTGLGVFLVSCMFVIHMRPWLGMSPDRVVPTMAFVSIVVSAGALVLPFRYAVGFSVINLLLMAPPLILLPIYRGPGAQGIVAFNIIQTLFLLMAARISDIERELASHASALEAASDLAARVAHNLNSPLAAVHASLSLLEEDIDSVNSSTEYNFPDKNSRENNSSGGNKEVLRAMSQSIERSLLISKGLHFFVKKSGTSLTQSINLIFICEQVKICCRNMFGDKRCTINIASSGSVAEAWAHSERLIHAVSTLIAGIVKEARPGVVVQIGIELREKESSIDVLLTSEFPGFQESNLSLSQQMLPFKVAPEDTENLELRMSKALLEQAGATFSFYISGRNVTFISSLQKKRE